MLCKKCGNPIKIGNAFCTKCGTKVEENTATSNNQTNNTNTENVQNENSSLPTTPQHINALGSIPSYAATAETPKSPKKIKHQGLIIILGSFFVFVILCGIFVDNGSDVATASDNNVAVSSNENNKEIYFQYIKDMTGLSEEQAMICTAEGKIIEKYDSGYESGFFDEKIYDEDEKGNYIIEVKSMEGQYMTQWLVLCKLDFETGIFRCYIEDRFNADLSTNSTWINLTAEGFKKEYGWGEENHFN